MKRSRASQDVSPGQGAAASVKPHQVRVSVVLKPQSDEQIQCFLAATDRLLAHLVGRQRGHKGEEHE